MSRLPIRSLTAVLGAAAVALSTLSGPAASALSGSEEPGQEAGYREAVEVVVGEALDVPVAFPNVVMPHRTYVVSDDWQLYGACQGVDFSKLAITTAKR